MIMPARDIRDLMRKLARIEEERGNVKDAKQYRAMARYWDMKSPQNVGRKAR